MDEQIIRLLDRIEKRLQHLEALETRPVVARYQTNAGQSIADSSPTVVNFEDVIYDTHSAVTIGAGWYFAAPVAGYYHVSVAVLFAATDTWGDGNYADLALFSNGNQFSTVDVKTNYPATAGQYLALSGSDIIHLAAAGTIYAVVYQNSGGALALYNNAYFNYIAIHKI